MRIVRDDEPASNAIVIEATRSTPYVQFDLSNGTLVIKGKSSPEDSIGFYSLIQTVVEDIESRIHVEIQLSYFNTSTSKCLFTIMRILEEHSKSGKEVQVRWLYDEDDEDMLEIGEDFQDLIDMPIFLIEV